MLGTVSQGLSQLANLDWVLICAYGAVLMGIGFYFTRRNKDTKSYFLAGRHAGWITVGAAMFAANISAEHFVGLAGTGYNSGFAVAQYELFAAVACMALGWIFIPFYIRAGVFTMPEFLERRYNRSCRTYLSLISLISYVLTKISVTLIAGSAFLYVLFGWNPLASSVALVIATGIYTVAGGLSAVIYTERIQAFVLVGGAVVLTCVGLNQAGGLSAVVATTPIDYWSMLKPINHPEFPWLGMIFGLPILGVWYWCTDQYMVQRALSAKNIDHGRGGTLLTGFFKILPMFIMVFPGIIALKLLSAGTEPNRVYPELVKILPVGVKGLIIAGILGAMMSSLSACFNSCSTLFTMDIYKPRRPNTSETSLVWIGRVATVIMVLLGLGWATIAEKMGGTQIYIYLQKIQAYISPPIAAVFLFGVLNKRLNGVGATASLWTGFVMGMGRLILEAGQGMWKWQFGEPLQTLIGMNFLHYAILMFIVCLVVLFIGSYMTLAADEKKLYGLTFATTPKDAKAVSIAESTPVGLMTTVVASGLLIAALVVIWTVFYVIIPLW